MEPSHHPEESSMPTDEGKPASVWPPHRGTTELLPVSMRVCGFAYLDLSHKRNHSVWSAAGVMRSPHMNHSVCGASLAIAE